MDGYCPDGYLDIFPKGEMCYALNKKEVSWDTAQFECFQSGGSLASIHSDEEQIALAGAVSRLKMNAWFGLFANSKYSFS